MHVTSSDGVAVAVHDLGGSGDHLLISHATGFHGRCYDPIAAALADRFHSVAFDYRGHGDTAQPDRPVDWQRYGDDAEAVARALPGPLVGFGHSMGGACLLMAAHRDPSLFRRLVLFEPIVFPPRDTDDAPGNPLAAGARRRRAAFPDMETAIANYAAKPPLSGFRPDVLEAYVRHGFRQGDDGQVHLKCRPETEAATFEMGGSHRTWDVLGEISVPVLVVAGRVDPMQPSAVAAGVAERLAAGTYLERADLDHFGPMTHPDDLAAIITRFATG